MNNTEKLNEQTLENISGGISIDEAVATAMEHAGLNKNQVDFVKKETDWEHGTKIYEIKLYQGRKEFEYEIDTSGNILKFEQDWD